MRGRVERKNCRKDSNLGIKTVNDVERYEHKIPKEVRSSGREEDSQEKAKEKIVECVLKKKQKRLCEAELEEPRS